MKKAFYIIAAAFSIFMTFGLTSCHDSIFETIENEIALDKSGLRGSIGSIVEYGGWLYVTPMNKGVLYRKSATARSKGGWNKISAPKTPVAIALSGSTLYMLSVDWDEGSGDYEGYNVPTYFEYTSTDGTNWTYINNKYGYTEDSSNLPARYKNQHCSVTAGNGKSYSIPSSYSTSVITTPNGSQNLDEGYIFAITATYDTVIVGTTTGIYSYKIQSNGSLTDKSTHVGDLEKDASSTFTRDVPVVYVPNDSRTKSETDAVIYAYNSPLGSSGTQNEGLMAYFPGSGWNRDH